MDKTDYGMFGELAEAWRRQDEAVERILREHPPRVEIPPRRMSRYQRLIAWSVAQAAVCAAALVWLVHIYDRRVEDVLDLVPHVVVGCTLLYGAVCSVRLAVLLRRHDPASTPPFEMLRFVEKEFRRNANDRRRGNESGNARIVPSVYQLSRAAVFSGLVIMSLATILPTYKGRSMSTCDWDNRPMALATTNDIYINMNNTSMA